MDKDSEVGQVETSPKKGRLVLFAGAVFICVGAAVGAYFLTPVSVIGHKPKAVEHSDENKATNLAKHGGSKSEHGDSKKEKKADSHAKSATSSAEDEQSPKFKIVGDNGIFTPDPIVISIRPTGRVRYLKLGFAVETNPESEAAFTDNELRIRDVLNVYLRSIDINAIEDPAKMSQIRSQIARRVELVVQPAPVHALLITDFILS